MNRGFIAAAWEILVVIVFLTMRLFASPDLMLGKPHTASMYRLLNHRDTLRIRGPQSKSDKTTPKSYQPPIGIALSNSSRAFVAFNRGDLRENPITLGELVGDAEEVPFPNHQMNTPPQGLLSSTSGRMLSSSDSRHLINAQAVVIDSRDRLPKLMGFDISNNSSELFKTILFFGKCSSCAWILNDIHIDLRKKLTPSGEGIAYISDNGIALSTSGKHLYFTPLASYDLYRVETAAPRANPINDPSASLHAAKNVQYLG
ncbi:hypothetical protein M422DRAFT_253124 [Sphaerobolus stellatus SS14]|uniref:Uncharacterized protein n=1 Tax=Sphaerobolus stellatus (strain SS14) TaxID=990650 RepID=A0A0C9VNG9_SPHS4|nr:hypothetical protein M422DRAFT_253124 [Sphaerobolus stellatus SS14]